MRPIDADWLLSFIRPDEKVIAPEQHTAQDIIMMIQTAPTIAPRPNEPIPQEQLQKMGGEKVVLHSALHGEGAYEAFQKIASEFYKDSTYKFAVLSFDADPRPDSVEFTAEFWSVPAGAENESPNDSLTLEELREMDGEPVWMTIPGENGGEWVIARNIDLGGVCIFCPVGAKRQYGVDGSGAIGDYGKTWLAYRRKPKEGTA